VLVELLQASGKLSRRFFNTISALFLKDLESVTCVSMEPTRLRAYGTLGRKFMRLRRFDNSKCLSVFYLDNASRIFPKPCSYILVVVATIEHAHNNGCVFSRKRHYFLP